MSALIGVATAVLNPDEAERTALIDQLSTYCTTDRELATYLASLNEPTGQPASSSGAAQGRYPASGARGPASPSASMPASAAARQGRDPASSLQSSAAAAVTTVRRKITKKVTVKRTVQKPTTSGKWSMYKHDHNSIVGQPWAYRFLLKPRSKLETSVHEGQTLEETKNVFMGVGYEDASTVDAGCTSEHYNVPHDVVYDESRNVRPAEVLRPEHRPQLLRYVSVAGMVHMGNVKYDLRRRRSRSYTRDLGRYFSKAMSTLLRHAIKMVSNTSRFLYMDTGGWCSIQDALPIAVEGITHNGYYDTLSRMDYSDLLFILLDSQSLTEKERFQFAVVTGPLPTRPGEAGHYNNMKNRFTVEDLVAIRCSQGHSIEHVMPDRAAHEVPDDAAARMQYFYHATTAGHISSILTSGLTPGGINQIGVARSHQPVRRRNAVMMSPFPVQDDRCQSGARKEAPVVVIINAVMAQRTCDFYFSDTGSIQAFTTIPPGCIAAIVTAPSHGRDVSVLDGKYCVPLYWRASLAPTTRLAINSMHTLYGNKPCPYEGEGTYADFRNQDPTIEAAFTS